jgi:hypothetical protein
MLTDEITEALQNAAAQQPFRVSYEPAIRRAHGIQRRRRQGVLAGALAVVVAAGASWAVAAAGAGPSEDQATVAPVTGVPDTTPKLRADPANGVESGQVLRLTGTGFMPAAALSIVVCATEFGGSQTRFRTCEVNRSKTVTADSRGSFSTGYEVARAMWTRDTGEVDCAEYVGACVISVSAQGSASQGTTTFIGFGARPKTSTVPYVQLNENGQLADGVSTTVTGRGFNARQYVEIRECPATTTNCSELPVLRQVFADATGSVSDEVRLATVIGTPKRKVSCASDCTLVASNTGAVRTSVRSRSFNVPQTASAPKTGQLGDPTWLPTGARLLRRLPWGASGVMLTYSLPGAVNADTVIEVTRLPDVKVSIPAIGRLDGVVYTDVSVSGNRAVLSYFANGYGTYRVEWLTSFGYYSVSVDRRKTPQGVSGISSEDLLHVATSIRS